MLSHNYIDELPPTIGLLRNLQTFYMDENDLTFLPPDVILNKPPFCLFSFSFYLIFLSNCRSLDWVLQFDFVVFIARQSARIFAWRNWSSQSTQSIQFELKHAPLSTIHDKQVERVASLVVGWESNKTVDPTATRKRQTWQTHSDLLLVSTRAHKSLQR